MGTNFFIQLLLLQRLEFQWRAEEWVFKVITFIEASGIVEIADACLPLFLSV